jgi:hypothetical protein
MITCYNLAHILLNYKYIQVIFMLNNYNNIRYMHVNFYKKPQIKSPNTLSKIEHSVLFLDYLAHFISNSTTKRVQGYGTVGLAHNTIRTYKSLFRIVKAYPRRLCR